MTDQGCVKWWHQLAAAQGPSPVCCCLPPGVYPPWRWHSWDIWRHWPTPCPESQIHNQQSDQLHWLYHTLTLHLSWWEWHEKGTRTEINSIKCAETIKKCIPLWSKTKKKERCFPLNYLCVQRSKGNGCLDILRFLSKCFHCFSLFSCAPAVHWRKGTFTCMCVTEYEDDNVSMRMHGVYFGLCCFKKYGRVIMVRNILGDNRQWCAEIMINPCCQCVRHCPHANKPTVTHTLMKRSRFSDKDST